MTEDLSEIKARIETEVFVTQKEKVEKLPSTRGTKVGETENKSKNKNRKRKSESPIDKLK